MQEYIHTLTIAKRTESRRNRNQERREKRNKTVTKKQNKTGNKGRKLKKCHDFDET
jgi:hypothetical protein